LSLRAAIPTRRSAGTVYKASYSTGSDTRYW